jgi:hypothetical protein
MNIERLKELREKHPVAALELDLVSGRVDAETGLVRPEHEADELQDRIELNVLEVLDIISEQGHSGFSHGYMCSLLIPLLKDMPITPLTGKDWEWGTDICSTQNKRCSKVFEDEQGRAYNVEGYAFSHDGGNVWYTNGDSRKYITFPCSNEDLETEYVIKE